jgi:effector-binding domain-containing protein
VRSTALSDAYSAIGAPHTRIGMDHSVSIVTTAATPTAVIAQATTWAEFPTLWGRLLGDVWTFLRTTDLRPGRNVMLYKDDVPNVEVGAEVAGAFTPSGRVVPSALPVGRAARTVARGAPSLEGLAAAHEAVLAWCADRGLETMGIRWEVYDHWRDDPDRFETAVYWLLSTTRSSAS